MKLNFFLLLLMIVSAQVVAQKASDSYTNYRQGLEVLDQSIAAHGGLDAIGAPVSFHAQGTIYNAGHYAKPEERREIPLVEDYFFYRDGISYERKNLTLYGNVYHSSALYKTDSLYAKDFFSSSVQKNGATVLNNRAYEIAKALPSRFLLLVHANRRTLSICVNTDSVRVLTFNDAGGNNFRLYFNSQFHLVSVETLKYSDIYGDYVVSTRYDGLKKTNGLLIPESRSELEYGKVERTLHYSSFTQRPQEDSTLYALDPTYKAPAPPSDPSQISRERIGKNLHVLKLNQINNRVIVAENADYFDLFESPKSIAINDAILSELASINPQKKIRNIFVSHHHPDHAGGLRTYSAAGVNVITTAGNVDYLSRISSYSHTLSKRQLTEKSKNTFEVIESGKSKRFKTNQNDCVVYNISDTDHTVEYLIFYFPAEKIIFAGDLANFPEGQKPPYSGQRGKSLLDLIERMHLKVEKIYVSWPLKGQKEFATLEDLRATQIK